MKIQEDIVVYAKPDSSDYTLKLSSPIDLTAEKIGFEIGVVCYSYGLQYANIYNGEITYYSFKKQARITASIPTKHYETEKDFVAQFNNIFKNEIDKKMYKLQYNAGAYLIHLLTDAHTLPYLKLSPNLARFMGLAQEYTTQGAFTSEQSPEPMGGSKYISIHCPQVESSYVGSTKEHLLCVLPFGVGEKTASSYHYEPCRIIYIPLIDSSISSLRFIFRNEFGDPFPFLNYNSLLSLSIRPALKSI